MSSSGTPRYCCAASPAIRASRKPFRSAVTSASEHGVVGSGRGGAGGGGGPGLGGEGRVAELLLEGGAAQSRGHAPLVAGQHGGGDHELRCTLELSGPRHRRRGARAHRGEVVAPPGLDGTVPPGLPRNRWVGPTVTGRGPGAAG